MDMDISMDIRAKSVDMDMDMDGKFHIHGNPGNDEFRRTTGQPRLSAIVQARRLSLFGHIARMPDETDVRSIITASTSEKWRKPPGRPRTKWLKTIQQYRRANNLSLDEAINVAENRPLWRLMSAPLAVHAKQQQKEDI